MVKIKQCITRYLYVGVIVFFCSCSMGLVWNSGHVVDGQYVPKKPNYELKNKPDNIVPSNLDTINIYREFTTYSSAIITETRTDFSFLRFYSKGRVLKASTYRNEPEILQKSYQEALSEKNIYAYIKHGYYYSKDGEKIQIETFISTNDTWPVSGIYKIDNYHLNTTGDTLTMQNPKSDYIIIYVKEKIPRVLEDYPVNW